MIVLVHTTGRGQLHEHVERGFRIEDNGIYGNRAIGRQELDDASRTARFTFDFSPQTVQSALSRWERRRLFA